LAAGIDAESYSLLWWRESAMAVAAPRLQSRRRGKDPEQRAFVQAVNVSVFQSVNDIWRHRFSFPGIASINGIMFTPEPCRAFMTTQRLFLCLILVCPVLADKDPALRAYEHGDFAKALHQWRALASKGDSEAQFRFAAMCERGEGTRVQLNEAANWYRKAAYQGHSQAQYALGKLYVDGSGVSQDYVQAHMWLDLAGSAGEGQSANQLSELTRKMSPAQISEAQRLAKDWEPAFPIGPDVSAPIILYMVHPECSDEAQNARYTGSVILDLIVNKTGQARDICPQRQLPFGLDQKAIEAVSKWKFRPGSRNGRPVGVQSTITVTFRLR
jgi:TonB family protein